MIEVIFSACSLLRMAREVLKKIGVTNKNHSYLLIVALLWLLRADDWLILALLLVQVGLSHSVFEGRLNRI